MRWFGNIVTLFFRSILSGVQLCAGVYRLYCLKSPVIAVFGGGRVKKGDEYAQMVYEFSAQAIQKGYSILTGGGPGVMEAANCGARDAAQKQGETAIRTMGVSVKGLDADFKNSCADVIKVDSFLIRKKLLVHCSSAFVVFPGGIGTMDEIFHVLNLSKHSKIKRIPVILVGTSYWQPLVTWYHDHGLECGLIKEEDRSLLMLADEVDQALEMVTLLER